MPDYSVSLNQELNTKAVKAAEKMTEGSVPELMRKALVEYLEAMVVSTWQQKKGK